MPPKQQNLKTIPFLFVINNHYLKKIDKTKKGMLVILSLSDPMTFFPFIIFRVRFSMFSPNMMLQLPFQPEPRQGPWQ